MLPIRLEAPSAEDRRHDCSRALACLKAAEAAGYPGFGCLADCSGHVPMTEDERRRDIGAMANLWYAVHGGARYREAE